MTDELRGGLAIRDCDRDDVPAILAIINAAAQRYRGVIPDDRWHEPYMPLAALRAEMDAGVAFTGLEAHGTLVGVMGIQPVRNVRLIRHAYVLPAWQGHGVGSRLIAHLLARQDRPVLIGTWQAATWAVSFYERHGFRLAPAEAVPPLLRAFWTVPDRQIESSVVLSSPPLTPLDAARLIREG